MKDEYAYICDDNDCADFCLTAQDDGLAPLIVKGDTVIAHTQDEVLNGDIAVIVIDGQTFLKRIFYANQGLIITTNNPQIEPIIIEESEKKNIRIIGKAISVIHKL